MPTVGSRFRGLSEGLRPRGAFIGFKLSVTSWIFCLLFLGTLAVCGGGAGGGRGDDKAPSGAQKGAVVKTIQAKETEFKLEPSEITLDKPGTYVFKAVNS